MRFLKRGVLFWIMLAAGLCCTALLLVRRAAAEDVARQVAYAISYADVEALATGNHSVEEWLSALSGAGARYLIGTDENEAGAKAAAGAAGMLFARSGRTAFPGDAFLLHPADDARQMVSDRAAPAGDLSVPLALVENVARTGVLMPAGFDPDDWPGPMVRTLYLYEAYAAGYNPESTAPPESENIIFRAVFERGMRLVVLTPLTDGNGAVVCDPSAYTAMLGHLTQRLSARGLTAGGGFSCLDAPRRNPLLLAGSSLAAAAMAVLFLCLLFPKRVTPPRETLLLCLGAAAAFGGAFAAPALLQKGVAFGAAVLAACYAALWLGYLADGGDRSLGAPPALRFPMALAGLLACGLGGGLYVGALLADRAYLLQFSVFSGVKPAQILPLAFAAVLLFFVLFRRNRRRAPLRVPPVLIVALTLCVIAALALLLLRSGDNAALVSVFETRIRTWLERVLYVRPRTKEFLLAFPALALFVTVCERRIPILALPLGVLSCIGATSVVNTFCHIFTPLGVSLIRTALSAGIGLALGLAAMGGLCLLLWLGNRKKLANGGTE